MRRPIVKIKDIAGPYCGSYSEGDKVFNHLIQRWDRYPKITVSFLGVKMTSSSFFNAAFGALVFQYPINDIQSKLRFIYLSDKDKFLLNKSMKAALKQAEVTV